MFFFLELNQKKNANKNSLAVEESVVESNFFGFVFGYNTTYFEGKKSVMGWI